MKTKQSDFDQLIINGCVQTLKTMKLTDSNIKEIAQELAAGMAVYINRETLEYRSILNWDDMADPEFWEEEMQKIEDEWFDFRTSRYMDYVRKQLDYEDIKHE